jgi:hypothetical protein
MPQVFVGGVDDGVRGLVCQVTLDELQAWAGGEAGFRQGVVHTIILPPLKKE